MSYISHIMTKNVASKDGSLEFGTTFCMSALVSPNLDKTPALSTFNSSIMYSHSSDSWTRRRSGHFQIAVNFH